MSIWKNVKKEGGIVTLDGEMIQVGQRIPMGLGFVELRDTKKAGLHLVRLSKKGHYVYSLNINSDGNYRIGPDRGHRVIPANEEQDPIKRILREMEIPVSKLRIVVDSKKLKVGERWYDNGHCANGRDTNQWFHDGEISKWGREIKEQPQGYFGGGGYDSFTISDFTYAVRVDYGRTGNGSRWSRPGEIVVSPECDSIELANVLAPIVFGEGANADYVGALASEKVAKEWVAENFEIEAHPEEDNAILVNGSRFILESGTQEPKSLRTLLQNHGMKIIEDELGDNQRFFLRALDDEKEAIKYILDRYRVVAVKQGNERHLKFASKKYPNELGGINSLYIHGGEDSRLRRIFNFHEGLWDILFVRATEQIEILSDYPRIANCNLVDDIWEAEKLNGNEWIFTHLAHEKNAVKVSLRDKNFCDNLICLSNPGRQNEEMGGSISAIMIDGDEGYVVESFDSILLIREGETRSFIFRIAKRWASYDMAVWGITLQRTKEGVTYKPFDNGKIYKCEGSGGSEVMAEVVNQ